MSSSDKTPKAQRSSETQDPTHQVKFLLSVWRNCDAGKVSPAHHHTIGNSSHVQINWAPVLEEFDINTQGAAYVPSQPLSIYNLTDMIPDSAKRLERLLKGYDMKVSQVMKHLPNATKNGNDAGSEPSSAKKRPADGTGAGPKTPAKKPRAPKAKAKAAPKAEVDDEDDEDVDMKSPPAALLKSEGKFSVTYELVSC
jgi:hypothetical protein